MQGVIVALAGLYAVSACFWRPFLDPIYTIYEIATALGEFTLVAAIQIDLSDHADVPVEFLLALSFAVIIANVGKQVRTRCCPAITLGLCVLLHPLESTAQEPPPWQIQAILSDRVMVLMEPVHVLLLNLRTYRDVCDAITDFIDR